MKNIFTQRWLFVSLFCCIGYWGQSQGLVTTSWANIGASNSNGDFQIIAIGKSDTIYALSGYNQVYKVSPNGVVTTNWLTSSEITSGSTVNMTGISVNKTSGDVYLLYTESGSYRIAKITPGKTITKSWSTLATEASVSLGYSFIRIDGSTGDIYLLKNNASIDKITSLGGAQTNLKTLTNTSAYAGADASGNMFLLSDNGTISKVTPAGTETTSWATFSNFLLELPPITDASGNVYMIETDYGSTNNLLKFNSSDGTQARSSSLGNVNIRSMGIDASGNVYMLNTSDNKIIKVSSTGILTSNFAALPIDNYSSSRGAMVVDASNNIYALNTGEGSDGGSDVVSKITSAGTVTPKWADMAVPFPLGITRDHSGNLFVANTKNNTVSKITSAGSVTAAWSNMSVGTHPVYIVADKLGNIFTSNTNKTVSKINSSGTATNIAVGSAYTTYSSGNQAAPIALDKNGNLYVGIRNGASSSIVKIATGGTTTTTMANLLSDPEWIAVDTNTNNLYVARKVARSISKVDLSNTNVASNTIANWAILPSPNNPIQIAVDATTGNVYTLNQTSGNDNVSKVTSAGVVTQSFASLSGTSSVGMFAGSNGSIYVLDEFDKTITRVKTDGTTEQVVSSGDGLNSVNLQKAGMVFDNANTFYLTTDQAGVARVQVRPTVNTVTIVSDNAITTKARLGNKVTVNFTTSEAINTPTATIAGTSATVTNLSGNTSWKAEVTLSTSNTTGTATFAISNIASSSTSIAASDVTTTTNGSRVIIDTITPALTTVAIVSNNSNTSKAKVGDKITLNFTSSEAIKRPTVTIGNGAATITNLTAPAADSTSWRAELTMLTANTQAQGQVVFSISISDSTGNTKSVNTTTNSSKVTYDTIKPILSAVTIVSNGSTSTVAGPTDSVTIAFTANEGLNATPSVVVRAGGQIIHNPVQVRRVTGNNWTAGFYMDQANDITGAITFIISNLIDTTGNLGTSVTSTTNASSVTFVKSKPTLTSVTIASNNATNIRRATTGNTVTLNFTASEAINTPVVKLTTLQRTVTPTNVSGDKLNWQATYTTVVGDPEDSVTVLIVPTSIYNIVGDEVKTTTNGSYVLFDKTKPTLSSVSIISNNPVNTSRAKTGDSVTVSFTASELLSQKPSITVAGQVIAASSVTNTSGNNWKGIYKFLGTETEDTVRFYISYVDSAGIKGDTVRITNNNSRVLFDKTRPTLSSVAFVSNNTLNTRRGTTGDSVTISFTASELLSQKPSISIAGQVIADSSVTNITGNNWKGVYKFLGTETEDTVRFYISYIDSAGNSGDTIRTTNNNSIVLFDKTKPTLSSVAIISNNLSNTSRARTGDSVTVSFTASELLSQKPSISIAGQVIADSSVTNITGNNWKGVYKFLGTETEDTVRFYISYIDSAGIKGDTIRTTNNNNRVIFDKSKPTLSSVAIISNNLSNTSRARTGDSVTVSFTVSELLLQKPSISIAGQVIADSSVTNITGNNWKGVYKFVGTETEDTVRFYISYIDSAGIKGDTIRTTNNNSRVIFDKTKPTLSSVAIISNNLSNTSRARTGDSVTVSFTVSELLLQKPSISIAGQVIADSSVTNITGNNWKGVYKFLGTETEDTVRFYISYIDSAGIKGDTIRTTNNNSSVIFDKTKPTLSSVAIISNNLSNTSRARTGDSVTVSFTVSELLLQKPSISIAGQVIADSSVTNITGNNWKGVYKFLGTETEDTVRFYISYIDSAGIKGDTIRTTNNNSIVIFDKTAPALNTVTILSNNINSNIYATTGDSITLNFTSAEPIVTPNVIIAGQSILSANVSNISGNEWRAVYKTQSVDPEGVISFQIAYKDAIGNADTLKNTTTNNSKVIFDKTAPSLTAVNIASNASDSTVGIINSVITLNFTANEGILTPTTSIAGNTLIPTLISGNNWKATYTLKSTDTEGQIPFTISYKDSAGNAGGLVDTSMNRSKVVFDKSALVLNMVSISSNNSTDTSYATTGDIITITFKASREINTPTILLAGNAVTASNESSDKINWKARYTMQATDAEGVTTMKVDFSDLAGNVGITANGTTNNTKVIFDKTPPTLSSIEILSSNSNTAKAKVGDTIILNIISNEKIITPVVTISSLSATVTNVSDNNWKASYIMQSADTEGNIPFSISYKNPAGLSGTIITATNNNSAVIFDKTLPILNRVSVISNNANTVKAKVGDIVTLSFTPNEQILSPIVTISGQAASVANISGNNWKASYTMQSTDVEGTIPFSIAFKDSASNSGITVTSTTDNSRILFDRTVPQLTSVSIASNNSLFKSKAKIGDVVTVNFTSSKVVLTPDVTISGQIASVTNISGNNWAASYTMQSSDVEGIIPFSIAFKDSASNSGISVITVTDNSSVLFDRTVPTLSNVSILSNNANTQKAKVGDIVTLSFTSNERILTPDVTISGQIASVTNISGNSWKASYTMKSSDVEGIIPFSIVFKDSASNSGISVTTVTDNSSVLFDRSVPTLSSVSILSNNANTQKAKLGDIITLSFTSNEGILTPDVTISGQTASVTNTSGNNWKASYTMQSSDVEGIIPFSIVFKDSASNSGISATTVTNNSSVLFDRTAPRLTNVSIVSNNSVSTSKATIGDLISVSFTSDEGILTPDVTISGQTASVTNISGNNWRASYTMRATDVEGDIPFSIAFKDFLSNVSTTVTATLDISKVIFDKTNPVLTNVNISSNNSVVGKAKIGNQITLRFVSSEIIQPPAVTIAGRTVTASGSGLNWSATYSMVNTDQEGNVTFNISFKDSSGIAGTSVSKVTDGSNVVFDKTAPVLNSISLSSNNIDSDKAQPGDIITVNFISNESLLTPTVSILGKTVNATNVSGNNWTASYNMTSRDAADLQSYSIVYYDLAGNKGITRAASSTVTSICPTSFPYSWNNNQFKDTGRYNVKLVNSEGTDSTAGLVLRFNPVPTIPVIIRSAASFCTGDSILLQSSAITNNQWVLNGNDITGETSRFLYTKALGLNTYTVRVTNNLNCYSVSTPVTTQYLSTVGTRISLRDTMVCKANVIPVTVNSIEPVRSYTWISRNTGFTASTQTVGLVNQDFYSVTVVLNNGCIINDTVNFRTTADTAIKARMVVSKQAFVNQQIKAVNLTSSIPQSQQWVVPTGADVLNNTPNELVVKFANPGSYKLYLNNTSYNICRSSDTATIVITTNDSSNVASNNATIVRNLTVGPNPTSGLFKINVELNRPGKTSVRIFDLNGTSVFQNIYQESVAKFSKDIDISTQPSQRTYVLIVQTDGGYEIRAIIKN
ncbi:MAG TPA: hypothetical protein VJA82_05150 [Sediminibacterium sp.]|uniref:hypothetical protein n=1 Tax=Sediminibacterium sp. TaxID=1917865 RepID=UPI0008B71F43|nr:hypothetical protein [Sediminibacterium sp.]OHC85687.1 MAG: hypothetical protein A2472_08040 [Sphingobacteriia bacterium RIFOXYC2_FULL_35_18]OHC87223.1 MAG: hypothetical protein A2546_04190 [Sphingobacteriia bacterium RIFOXYD2_FULL_35_12]HLD52671.1 hypothetical protein [Sediminibacterium sp.]